MEVCMQITWHGHSCFQVETDQGNFVFDPYKDHSVPGLAPLFLHTNMVLTSHNHADHCGDENVRILYICPFQMECLYTYHDDQKGALRGINKIFIIYAEGMRIAHLGDLGCDLTDDEVTRLKNCDVVMIPVGGHYTIDYRMAHHILSRITPRIIIPMHYRSERFGYPVLDTVDRFLKESQNIVYYPTDTITITKETESQTAVLTYMNR